LHVPGTFEVSTVCTVGGAAGATTGCNWAGCVGLDGCAGLKPGLCTKSGLVTGIKPLDGGAGVTAGVKLCPGTVPG